MQHANTLWGVDYAADGNLSKLWITDSDDAEHAICPIDVIAADNGKIYFDEENGDIGNYEWYNFLGITGIHIYGVSALPPPGHGELATDTGTDHHHAEPVCLNRIDCG